MNLKKIKCVILDFDKTMYSGSDLSGWPNFYNNFFKREGLLNEVENPIDFLMKQYPKYHDIQAAYAYFRDNNLSDEKFREFQAKEIYDFRSPQTRFIEPDLISKFSKIVPLYIISDSSLGWVEFYLDFAKINKKDFVKIYTNGYTKEDFTKLSLMKKVLEETGLKPNEIIMIGDNKKCDIVPAKKLGFQTCLVKDVNDTKLILSKIMKLRTF